MTTPITTTILIQDSSFTRILSTLSCTIVGEPLSKARARVTKYGSYTPQATADYERLVANKLLEARMRAQWPAGGWFSPEVQYALEIQFVVTTFAGDIDNKAKSILDAGNKLLWPDDTRVVVLVATKRRAGETESPCARVRIWAVTASEKSSAELAKKPVRKTDLGARKTIQYPKGVVK